jgi:hypothetical protein
VYTEAKATARICSILRPQTNHNLNSHLNLTSQTFQATLYPSINPEGILGQEDSLFVYSFSMIAKFDLQNQTVLYAVPAPLDMEVTALTTDSKGNILVGGSGL